MSEEPAHFIAISGIRGSGRTRLFKELGSLLPAQFGDQTFAFFEDPFDGLPHPLLWDADTAKRDPTTHLFECWAVLNEFNVTRLLTALAMNDVVVVDGYGLNALLYATAGTTCPQLDEATTRVHHAIVDARVLSQGIKPPQYFVTQADPTPMTAYLQGLKPGLTKTQCHAFLTKEACIIDKYFGESTGQKGVMLPHTLSIREMAEIVANTIEPHIEERRQLAA